MSTNLQIPAEGESSAEIEKEIRSTRQRMDSTLDELGNRLNPRSMVNSLVDWWETKNPSSNTGNQLKSGYRTLTRHVKDNPVPALLIGAGVTWLLLNSEDEEARTQPSFRKGVTDYDHQPPNSDEAKSGALGDIIDSVKEKAGEARDAVAGAFDAAKSKVENLVGSADEISGRGRELLKDGSQLATQAGETLHRNYDASVERLKDAVEDYPLAVGAAFLALGALAGVLLPSTRKEDQLLGEKSDSLLDAAKEKGEELLEQGKEVAGKVGEKVLEQAEKAGLSPENAAGKLTEFAGAAGDVVRSAATEISAAVRPSDPQT